MCKRQLKAASAIPILLFLGCNSDILIGNELQVAVYTSSEEVQAAEPGPRTWLPCLMPEDFTRFTEIHRADNPLRCGLFEMDDANTRAFAQTLTAQGRPAANPPVHHLRSFHAPQTEDVVERFDALAKEKPWYRVNCQVEGTFDYFVDEDANEVLYVSVD